MSDEWPSGKRIWELTQESIKIDRMANDGCSLCYELYIADFEEMADGFARRLNDTDNRFFETVCAIGNNYRPPSKREPDEPSAHEIRLDLQREVYGWDEHEFDEPAYEQEYEHDMDEIER